MTRKCLSRSVRCRGDVSRSTELCRYHSLYTDPWKDADGNDLPGRPEGPICRSCGWKSVPKPGRLCFSCLFRRAAARQ